MPLINCKIHLEVNWNNNCVMDGADTYAGSDNANNTTQNVANNPINNTANRVQRDRHRK